MRLESLISDLLQRLPVTIQVDSCNPVSALFFFFFVFFFFYNYYYFFQVLLQAQKELLTYCDTGISVLGEWRHQCRPVRLLAETRRRVTTQLRLPELTFFFIRCQSSATL